MFWILAGVVVREVFWILGSVFFYSGKCSWILGSVLDSGKCFEFREGFDSGKCLVPMGHHTTGPGGMQQKITCCVPIGASPQGIQILWETGTVILPYILHYFS